MTFESRGILERLGLNLLVVMVGGGERVLNILNNGLRLAEISRNPMGMESCAWTLTGVSIHRLKV